MAEGISVFETVLGAPYETDAQLCFRRLFEAITGEVWTAEQAHAEEQRIRQLVLVNEAQSGPPMQLTDVERALSHQVLAQLMHDTRLWCSNFFDWPLFAGIFANKGHATNGGNALMLGANESLSSLTFAALAKEVYKTDRAYIIDLHAGDDKRKHGNFMYGDALRLPFCNDSMSVVQSNQLLYKIVERNDKYATGQAQFERVVQEAARVLRPGGQLFMREILTREHVPIQTDASARSLHHYEEMKMSVTNTCKSAGFDDVVFSPVALPKSLKGLVDPEQDFWKEGFTVRPSVYMIYASLAE